MSLTLAGNGTITGVDADASGLLSELGGIGSNVVQAVKTDTFSTTSTTFTDVTGLAATITPTSATSKILIVAQTNMSATAEWYLRLDGGNASGYVGDTAGSRATAASAMFRREANTLNFQRSSWSGSVVYLDSPATTSAVSYKVQLRVDTASGGTAYLNRALDDTDSGDRARTSSSLTVIEVAA